MEIILNNQICQLTIHGAPNNVSTIDKLGTTRDTKKIKCGALNVCKKTQTTFTTAIFQYSR